MDGQARESVVKSIQGAQKARKEPVPISLQQQGVSASINANIANAKELAVAEALLAAYRAEIARTRPGLFRAFARMNSHKYMAHKVEEQQRRRQLLGDLEERCQLLVRAIDRYQQGNSSQRKVA